MTARTSAAIQEVQVEIDAQPIDCIPAAVHLINVAYGIYQQRQPSHYGLVPSSPIPMSSIPSRVESVDIVDTSVHEPPGTEGVP